jgi:hypothetical protein
MPEVNGLFSEIDLRSGDAPEVTLTTKPHRTVATTRQTVARIVAALTALLALVLVGTSDVRGKPRTSATRLLSRALRSLSWADAVVLGALVCWWVLAPAHWDDGWVAARQSNFASAGGLSNYYDSLGSNLPNGYWLEWLQHWLTQSSNTFSSSGFQPF